MIRGETSGKAPIQVQSAWHEKIILKGVKNLLGTL